MLGEQQDFEPSCLVTISSFYEAPVEVERARHRLDSGRIG
jgi:hypothetical protein